MIVTLHDLADVYHFTPGIRVEWVRTSDGGIRAPRWYDRVLRFLTRPFRRRTVCAAVDIEAGTVTLAPEHKWWRFL